MMTSGREHPNYSGANIPLAHEAWSEPIRYSSTRIRQTELYPSPPCHFHLDMRASGNA